MQNVLRPTEEIWEEINNRIRKFIRNRVEDDDTSEDLVQEVFVRVHQKMCTLKNSERLESWLYQIARNVIIDHYRSRKTFVEISDNLSEPEIQSIEPDASDELSGSMRRMAEELPEPYREALLLTEFGGMSQQEMANHLGISVSGAKSRVQRARQKIKDDLLRCCHFEFDRYGRVIDFWEHCCCCPHEINRLS